MSKKWEKAPYQQVPYKPGVEVTLEPIEGAIASAPSVEVHQSKGRGWFDCEECGREIWRDLTGEFYHRLSCSKTNGIGYKEDHVIGETKCQCVQCLKFRREQK